MPEQYIAKEAKEKMVEINGGFGSPVNIGGFNNKVIIFRTSGCDKKSLVDLSDAAYKRGADILLVEQISGQDRLDYLTLAYKVRSRIGIPVIGEINSGHDSGNFADKLDAYSSSFSGIIVSSAYGGKIIDALKEDASLRDKSKPIILNRVRGHSIDDFLELGRGLSDLQRKKLMLGNYLFNGSSQLGHDESLEINGIRNQAEIPLIYEINANIRNPVNLANELFALGAGAVITSDLSKLRSMKQMAGSYADQKLHKNMHTYGTY